MAEETKKKIFTLGIIVTLLLIGVTLSGCVGENGTEGKTKLIQTGSSTVLPLAIAWAEEFIGADISVSGGGSSHGINALLNGDAQLADASRLMKGSDYEKVGCDAANVNPDGTASSACKGILPTKT